MKRPIKFRAKRLPDGKWVYGDLTHATRITVDADVPCLRVCGYDVDEDTIGQFTGFKDRNGSEIYEDDIVRICDRSHLACIHWNYEFSGFIVDWDSAYISLSSAMAAKALTVVGNKHDNPELLQNVDYNE